MTRCLLPALTPALLLLTGCGTPGLLLPGNAETDRIAETVTVAISWPRQDSAMAYARAASETTAGEDGRLAVVGVEELETEERGDPFARLMYRVYLEGSTSGWTETAPVTACYHADFGFDGVIDMPRRTRCPGNAEPLKIPPAPETAPAPAVAPGSEGIVRKKLAAPPVRPEAAALRSTLERALPVMGDQAAPEVEVVAAGADVGVAVRGQDECVLGARVGDAVQVWRPSDVQLQPGELTCDPETALHQLGQRPPH